MYMHDSVMHFYRLQHFKEQLLIQCMAMLYLSLGVEHGIQIR